MAKRLSTIEKLARAICWSEFSSLYKKQTHHTEASYWLACDPELKKERIEEARRWCWIQQNVDVNTLNDAGDHYRRITRNPS